MRHPRQCSHFLHIVDDETEAWVKSLPQNHTTGAGISDLACALTHCTMKVSLWHGGLEGSILQLPPFTVSVTMNMCIIGTYHFYKKGKMKCFCSFFLTKKVKWLLSPSSIPSPYTSQCCVWAVCKFRHESPPQGRLPEKGVTARRPQGRTEHTSAGWA